MPDDYREKYNMPFGLTPKEMINIRSQNGKRGLHSDINNFRSLMPFMTFEDGKLTELILNPIRLDMHTGFPYIADEEEIKIIFDYLCKCSKPFGTELKLKNGNIEVKICD